MKQKLTHKILSKIPIVRDAYLYRRYCRPIPGHFYSPVVDLEDLETRQASIWKSDRELIGIDLNRAGQVAFLEHMVKHSSEIPFQDNPTDATLRYFFDNHAYMHADGLVLFTMLMSYKPTRIIEVGSGFSSSLMLDTNDRYLDKSIQFTFIEPNPEIALRKLLRPEDYKNTDVKKNLVQEVDLGIFQTLGPNDILLIDNSHVSKTGSDVNYVMTEILPRLKKGVLVHFHDIFYPFEYPKEWLLNFRLNWNEIYSLHNFLLYNNSFEIVFFSDYMQKTISDEYRSQIPLFFTGKPGSIWLRKIA